MIVVAALYEFKKFSDFAEHRQPLKDFFKANGIKGTLLLAAEGINGTVSGDREGIDALKVFLSEMGFNNLEYKESFVDSHPFMRGKVKLKKEIVTLGVSEADPMTVVGSYVEPEEWNKLISRPDVITIDTRNDYEVMVGTFKGAVDPKTKTFKEFINYTENNLSDYKDKPVAMYCTGGIRCERSTAYLKALGFKEVYHLKGGILRYLEEMPEEKSLWEGECFVFDQRVTVKHGMKVGSYSMCHSCRMPINEDDKKSAHYREGVSCPHCYDKYDEEHYNRVAERQKQVELAVKRGAKHMGEKVEVRGAEVS